MTSSHDLAQVNLGRIVAPLDDTRLQGFVDGLEPLNAVADAAPGFVWRLQDDDGDATSFRLFDDDLLLINLSVWASVDALRAFVYRSDHVEYLRRRRDWFQPMSEAFLALWWVPAGTVPTPREAVDRVEHLRAHGPSAEAFTFRELFPPPSSGTTA